MGNEMKSFEQSPHFIVIVSFIKAQALRMFGGGRRPLDRDAFNGFLGDLEIVLVRTRYGASYGYSTPVGQETSFYALLGAVSGIGASFFPRERRLAHRPIHRTEAPINAFQLVISFQALLPELPEHSCLAPLLESAVGRARGAEACYVQSVPLASRFEHEEDGVHRAPVINTLSVAPQRVMGDVLWQERFDLFPESVGDEKVLADTWLFCGLH